MHEQIDRQINGFDILVDRQIGTGTLNKFMEDYLDRSIDRQVNIDVYPKKKYKNKLWQIYNIYRKIDIYRYHKYIERQIQKGIIDIQKDRFKYREIDIDRQIVKQKDRQLNGKIER